MSNTPVSLVQASLAGDITAPVTKLIEVASQGLGTLYEPRRIREQAKAEAEATKIRADAEGQAAMIQAKWQAEKDALEARTAARTKAWEMRRQKNIEAIVDIAHDQLPQSVSADKVDDDWILQFFSLAQDVNNEELQAIWAKILSGEIAQPGSYSLRTLFTMRVLRQSDAILFRAFANFLWGVGVDHYDMVYFYNQETEKILLASGINFGHQMHLEALGLISMYPDVALKADEPKIIDYISNVFSVVRQPVPSLGPSMNVRRVSDIGMEIVKLCDRTPNMNYLNVVVNGLRDAGYLVQQI